MKLRNILFSLSLCYLSCSAWAGNQAIKENLNPTSPAGALTIEQIEPLSNTAQKPVSNNALPQAPVAPVTIETSPTDTITPTAPITQPPASVTKSPATPPAP